MPSVWKIYICWLNGSITKSMNGWPRIRNIVRIRRNGIVCMHISCAQCTPQLVFCFFCLLCCGLASSSSMSWLSVRLLHNRNNAVRCCELLCVCVAQMKYLCSALSDLRKNWHVGQRRCAASRRCTYTVHIHTNMLNK